MFLSIKKWVLYIIIIQYQCASPADEIYRPDNLTRLSYEQMIGRAFQKQQLSPYVVFKDSLGNPLPDKQRALLNRGELFTDQYVNENNEVVEVVARRPRSLKEEVLILIIEEAHVSEPPLLTNVDCHKAKEILEEIYDKDQGARNGAISSALRPGIDLENSKAVVSILEACPFPTKAEIGKKGMDAIFFVIQHAFSDIRARYYLAIEKMVESGDMEPGKLALITDRILVEHGKEQAYGSQVFKDDNTGKYELFPLRDPLGVNKRRAAMGLGPIEEYLKNWDISFENQLEKWKALPPD
ncbi:MAG: hypothetical protein J5I94_11745 [Phaeodactylibacter sp.]|nr:hypothetical protein [Phaeodactylibacter sp.]